MTTRPDRTRSVTRAELVASLLQEGLDLRLRLSGWSMKPLVPSGSLVRFRASLCPVVGDVVLAQMPDGSLLAHRVIGMDDHHFWTKGDACRTADEPLPRDQVLACAVRREGPLPLPLRGFVMRTVGLLLNRCYPPLVAFYRGLVPRKTALGEGSGC